MQKHFGNIKGRFDDEGTDYGILRNDANLSWFAQETGLNKANVGYYKEFIQYAEKEQLNLAKMTSGEVTKAYQKWGTEVRGISIQGTAATKAMGKLKSIGASIVSAGAVTIAMMAISKLIQVAQDHITTMKEAKQALEEYGDQWNDTYKDISKNSKELSELSKTYDRLSQGVDNLGNNVSLTDEEYSKYLETVSSISEIMPDLTTYFNEQGQAIGFAKGQIEDIDGAYKKYLRERAAENWSGDNRKSKEAAIKGLGFNDQMSDTNKVRHTIDYFIDNNNDDKSLNRVILNYGKSTSSGVTSLKLNNGTTLQSVGSIPSGYFDKNKKYHSWNDLTDEEKEKINSQIRKQYSAQINAQITNTNSQARKMLLENARLADGYDNLTKEQESAISSYINSVDWVREGNLKTIEDFDNTASEIVSAVMNDSFVEAINGLNSKELDGKTVEEAKGARDRYIQQIADALGVSGDEQKFKALKLSFGIQTDDEGNDITEDELINSVAEKTGLTPDKIKTLFTKGELKLIASIDFQVNNDEKVPENASDDEQKLVGEHFKKRAKDLATYKAANADFEKVDRSLTEATGKFVKNGKAYVKISKVVNGEMYLTETEMAELCNQFPDLSKYLQNTSKGWTLEAGAMDTVNNSIMTLQQSYIAAQQFMTSEATQAAIQRMNLNMQEIQSIQTVAQMLQWLSNQHVTLAVGSDGSIDTSAMSEEDQFKYNIAYNQWKLNKTRELVSEASNIGKTKSSNDKEKQKRDKKKQIKEAKEEQVNADFKHKIEEITSALDKYVKKLEALKTAQDKLFDSDYVGKLDLINQRYAVQNEYAAKSKTELDSLLATTPATAKGWEELASAVENVSQRYFEGKRALLEYDSEIAQVYTNAVKSIGELSTNALDKANNQFSKNVKALEEGGLAGIQFSLKPVVPENAVEKQRKENLELEKEQEAYQQKVNEIKQIALDKMKEYEDTKRAENLADLQNDLNDLETAAMDGISNVIDTLGTGLNLTWEDFAKELKEKGIEIPIKFIGDYINGDALTDDDDDARVRGNYKHNVTNPQTGQTSAEVFNNKTKSSVGYIPYGTPIYDEQDKQTGTFGQGVKANGFSIFADGSAIWQDEKGNWRHVKPGSISLKANGGSTFGDTIVNEKGQESYIGKDGKLHLFKKGTQFFNTDEVIRVFNAEDTKKIRKYTGDKYFNEPIGDLSKVTQFADGNINAIFGFNTLYSQYDKNPAEKLEEESVQEHYKRIKDIQDTALADRETSDVTAYDTSEQMLAKYYNDKIGLQTQSNDITTNLQVNDNNIKLTQEQNYANLAQNLLQGLYDWISQNPLKAPELDDASWQAMVDKAIDYMQSVQMSISGGNSTYYDSNTGNAIVDTALSDDWAVKYVYGGTSKSDGGYDCSGFVQGVFASVGKNIPRSTYTQIDGGTPVNKANLQPGDLVFYGSGKPTHVGIYIGNGQIVHSSGGSKNTASNPGKGRTVSSIDYRSDYFGARRYATGTHDYGIAGENYKREYLIDKKTGEWTEIDSPTLIDTDKVDVVGEKASEKINEPLPMYKDGTLTNNELLSIISKVSAETGVPANIIAAVAQQETGGKWYDSVADGTGHSYGYMMLYDNGAIADIKARSGVEQANKAKTDHYTNVLEGAKLLSRLYSNNENNWQTALSRYNGSGEAAKKYGAKVWQRANSTEYLALNGNINNISTYLGNIASNTSDIKTEIRKSFKTQLQEVINGSKNTADSNSIEDALLNKLKKVVPDTKKSIEKYVTKFTNLQNYQKGKEGFFSKRTEEVKNLLGTPEYNQAKEQLDNEIAGYSETLLSMSAEITQEQARDTYETSKAVYDSALAYFNERKAAGATADELSILADCVEQCGEECQKASDAFVTSSQQLTDYKVKIAEREVGKYDLDISWYDKWLENEKDNPIATGQILSAKQERLQSKMAAAHENANREVWNGTDEKVQAVLKEFGTRGVESWFDANGELTKQFEVDMENLTQSGKADLATSAKSIAEILATDKKNWFAAEKEEIEVIKQLKMNKVDQYVKLQERLMKSLDFNKSISEALTNAKSAMYDFFDTLRNEQVEITKTVMGNMQIDDWLSEDTRKQLFNTEDYEKEISVINDLQSQSQKLYQNYMADINSLSEDELYKQEEITNAYNRQLDTLKDKLSIAKQELQVAKDKTAFENTLKERDTQIIMGNRVQNVADPEKLKQAAETMAQSQAELVNLNTKSAEQADIRKMQESTDMIELEKGAMQYRIDSINEMTDEEKLKFSDFVGAVEKTTAMLASLRNVDPNNLVRNDNTDNVYKSLDHSKINGYEMTEDYSNFVDMVQEWVNTGQIDKKLGKMVISNLEERHDNKTTSDSHNYGYDLYNTDNSYLWQRGMLPMSDYKAFWNYTHVQHSQKSKSTISGEVTALYGKLPKMTGDISPIFEVLNPDEVFGSFAPNSSASSNQFANLMKQNYSLQSIIGDMFNQSIVPQNGLISDNSISVDKLQVTLVEPVTDANQFLTSFTNKVRQIYPTIKNQR